MLLIYQHDQLLDLFLARTGTTSKRQVNISEKLKVIAHEHPVSRLRWCNNPPRLDG